MADVEREVAVAADAAEVAAESERKLARTVGFGLPVVTLAVFLGMSFVYGLAPGILVLVGGTMLGVIAIFWASLRVLSGDAPIAPELEALDAGAHEVDQLAVRKRMLLRALKDLDNERALGKLDAEDHEAIASTYRTELKDVLRQMDESLAPFRKKAEELAASFVTKTTTKESAAETPEVAETPAPARQVCAGCATSNEPDAQFCKKCGKALAAAAKDEESTDEA